MLSVVPASSVPDALHVLRAWQAFAALTLSARTLSSYRYFLLRFMADTLLSLDEAAEEDVSAYLASLPAGGTMRGMMLRALKNYYSWRGRDPTARITVKRPKYGPAPSLSEEELTRLVIAASWRSERRGWAMLLFYATGARLSSLCAVTQDDVQNGMIHFRVAKGDRPYSIRLGSIGREAVAELQISCRKTLLGVGPGRLWQWINQASLDSGVRAWPHLLRHKAATDLYEATKDPVAVKDFLNHADLSQVPRYVHTGVPQGF